LEKERNRKQTLNLEGTICLGNDRKNIGKKVKNREEKKRYGAGSRCSEIGKKRKN